MDGPIYGFNKKDAEELIDLIGNGDVEFPEIVAPSEGIGIFGYTLTSGPTTGSVFNLVAGVFSATALATGQTLYDPLGMFGDQTTGDQGFCFRVGSYYYKLQAPCKT